MGAPLARDTPLYEALLARADHATRAIDWCMVRNTIHLLMKFIPLI